ncbi:MAG: hypothetical protein AB7G28_17250 [Pirellulales bacterium]
MRWTNGKVRLWFGTVLLLASVQHAAADPPRPETAQYPQKIATLFATDAAEVPSELRQAATPSPWTHWERGPVDGLQEFARTDSGVVWLGGQNGVARFDPQVAHSWDRWQYFWGRRWLPDNDVQNIVVDRAASDETVWIRTSTSVARIEFRPLTLAEKAAHFEEMVDERHVRHGFVTGCVLRTPGDLASSQTRDDDNDGLWTAMYLAAQCYRYAATGETDARAKAERSLAALMRLETIDPIDGFFARSYRTLDEAPFGDPEGEWHRLADGKTEWKGDTSSDEQVGHYYAYSVYYDLVATDAEKERLREHVAKLTDYLLDHGDELLDVDGRPTRWGRYSPEYYATPEGAYEKPLRCVEFLSYLKTASHMTGDDKYEAAYQQRVRRGDAEATRYYRRWATPEYEINYSDDELYFLAIDPLLKYERDPRLREAYLDSLRFTWSQVEREHNPLWNYIALARTGDPLSDALRNDSRRTLERVPWDLRDWRAENSQRQDVSFRPELDRAGRRELVLHLPPDERGVHKHNSSPFFADEGGNGGNEEAPTLWLLPYWLGRYHHFGVE